MLWDALAWFTVMFPFFTGGVWIRRSGLKLELTQIDAQVFALVVIALLLWRVRGISVTEASSVRVLLKIWRSWSRLVGRRPHAALWGAGIFTGTLLALVGLRRHWAFHSGAADLGIFTNVIWNLTHGNGYVSSVKDGINLFTDHQSPVLWTLAPLFALLPRAETLLVVQGFGLALGALPMYMLARQHLPGRPAFAAALPLLYWAYLPTRNANAFDFHPEVFILPCFLAAIAFLQAAGRGARGAGFVFLLLALAGKESSGPLAAGLGVAWLLGAGPEGTRRFTRRLGAALVPVGIGLFVFDLKLVPRLMGGGDYPYNAQYSDFGGGSVGAILLAPLTHTKLFFSRLFGVARLKFVLALVGPLGFLPFVGWRPLVASVPCFMMLFLTEGDHRISPAYHYSIEPSVGLLWAVPVALAALLTGAWSRFFTEKRLLIWLAAFAFLFFGRSELYRIRYFSPDSHMDWMRREFLPAVAPEAAVSATGALVPHLAARHWAHHHPKLMMPGGGTVDCVIYDPALNQWPLATGAAGPFFEEVRSRGFTELWRCRDVVVYSRPGGRPCLQRRPECY